MDEAGYIRFDLSGDLRDNGASTVLEFTVNRSRVGQMTPTVWQSCSVPSACSCLDAEHASERRC